MPRRLFFALLVAGSVVVSSLPAFAAGDPSRSKQWGLDRIKATTAWATSKGAGVTIAIVDTGIDLDHPDLKSKITGHYTCMDGSCKTGGNDDNAHGSHVAGIAAAATGNGIGIAGVAPAAKLMAVKVLDSDGSGKCDDAEMGIKFAVNHGARVINLSLGPDVGLLDSLLGDCNDLLQRGAAYAYGKGAFVAIAAGNDSLDTLYSSSAVEVVGATGPDDEVAYYSSTGADVYAPGGDQLVTCSASSCIYSTWTGGGYDVLEGTSQATPHVAGVAALLMSMGYSNAQAMKRINSTADSVDGIHRVNAARAVGPPTAPSPSATQTSSSPSATSTPSHGSASQVTSDSPKPSATDSKNTPEVLAVVPTERSSTVARASGPTKAASSSRTVPIAFASALLASCVIAAALYARKRATVGR